MSMIIQTKLKKINENHIRYPSVMVLIKSNLESYLRFFADMQTAELGTDPAPPPAVLFLPDDRKFSHIWRSPAPVDIQPPRKVCGDLEDFLARLQSPLHAREKPQLPLDRPEAEGGGVAAGRQGGPSVAHPPAGKVPPLRRPAVCRWWRERPERGVAAEQAAAPAHRPAAGAADTPCQAATPPSLL